MAAVTDLTWQQLNDALGSQVIAQTPNGDALFLTINLNLLLPTLSSVNEAGVIKALTMLLDAARKAQDVANTGKAAGEKLTAFPAPTFGTLANGYAPVTKHLAPWKPLHSCMGVRCRRIYSPSKNICHL